MFPAPPLPLANLLLVAGRLCSKREAGPVAMLPVVVFGALTKLPAPPRPE
jgi:membrane protein DedA with SNARE-associated domain